MEYKDFSKSLLKYILFPSIPHNLEGNKKLELRGKGMEK